MHCSVDQMFHKTVNVSFNWPRLDCLGYHLPTIYPHHHLHFHCQNVLCHHKNAKLELIKLSEKSEIHQINRLSLIKSLKYTR